MGEALMPRQRLLADLAEQVVAVRNPNCMSRVDEVSVAAFQLRTAALALLAAVREREAPETAEVSKAIEDAARRCVDKD